MAGNWPGPDLDSAGRVEIAVLVILEDDQNTDSRWLSFYLKASFPESEIGEVRFCKNLPLVRFRRPYPTLLTKTAWKSQPGNPVLPHNRTFPGFWNPLRIRTSLGVDFQKGVGFPGNANRKDWIFRQILFSFPMENDARQCFPGKHCNSVLFCEKQSI